MFIAPLSRDFRSAGMEAGDVDMSYMPRKTK